MKFNTLTAVQKYLLENTNEKVLEFNGYELKTNKGSYGLCDGEVHFTKKGK